MNNANTPVWKVMSVNDTSKLEQGDYVDYRDIAVRLHNGDIIHVFIPTSDYSADKAAEQIAHDVFEIVNTLQLESDVTAAMIPRYQVDVSGNVAQMEMTDAGQE